MLNYIPTVHWTRWITAYRKETLFRSHLSKSSFSLHSLFLSAAFDCMISHSHVQTVFSFFLIFFCYVWLVMVLKRVKKRLTCKYIHTKWQWIKIEATFFWSNQFFCSLALVHLRQFQHTLEDYILFIPIFFMSIWTTWGPISKINISWMLSIAFKTVVCTHQTFIQNNNKGEKTN